MDLKEPELLELIKSGVKVVVDVWMDNCPFCDDYAPIFARQAELIPSIKFAKFHLPANSAGGSEFKKNYMKAEPGKGIKAPATMIFEGGELKHRHYGIMSAEQLVAFVQTGTPPVDQRAVMTQELRELFGKKGEIITLYEQIPAINGRIQELKNVLEGRA